MIGHLTYLNIPQTLRSRAVNRTRDQIRDTLTSNFLSPDQVQYLHQKLEHLARWEHGLIELPTEATHLPPNRPPHPAE